MSASASTVLTLGLGNFSDPSTLLLLGFGISSIVAALPIVCGFSDVPYVQVVTSDVSYVQAGLSNIPYAQPGRSNVP